jgi:hypothetical protein
MAREKIVLDTDRILGGKAGLLAGAARARAAEVQGQPRADRATAAKVLVKVTTPATRG